MIRVCPNCQKKNALPTEGDPKKLGRAICASCRKPLFHEQTTHPKPESEKHAYTWPNGDRYVGQWKDGKRHGHGVYTYADGSKYVGRHAFGNREGQGTLTWLSGQKYVGEWKDNKRKGRGTLTTADGHKYVGDFKDNKYHGHGIYTWPDGKKYVGESKNSQKNGQGTLTWPDGQKYVGEWKFDRRSGHGIYTWPDGKRYVGESKDNKYHGQGRLTLPDGKNYSGDWKNDKKHGQGTLTTSDGQKYVGEWKFDKRHGQGKLTKHAMQMYVGEWRYGVQVSSLSGKSKTDQQAKVKSNTAANHKAEATTSKTPFTEKKISICTICRKGAGELTELRNGKYVHEQCLMLDISQEQNQIFSQRDALAEEIDILTDETNSLYPNTSFWTSIFGNEEEENRVSEAKEKLQAQIAYKRKQIEKLTLQDDKLMLRNNQYLVSNATEINDCIKYWPSYPPDYFWYNLKQQALQKCNFKCKSCRKKANQTLDLHHLRPLALGGLNELENLNILCRTCHQARHSHQFTGQDAAQKTSRIKNKLTNLDKVKLALSSNKRLWIRYTDDKGTQTERWIKVYRINKKWVESRCELRNDDRSFRIDRIDFAKVYGMKDT